MGAPGPGSTGTSLGGRTSPGGFSSSGSAGAGGMADDPAAGFMGEGRKHSLLGDLHMKQAQFQQARDMYAKAVDTCKKALEKRGTTGYRSADLLVELELVEHLTKLGQAYQGQGQNEQARKILQEITQITQRTSGAAQTGSKPPAGTTPKPLPNRLIISVSKKLLGEVGKGKMGVDEFRKNATVQYLDFSKPVSEKAIIEDSLTKPPAKP
jgi:tetratricopeptide (TPR) repeat protein